MTGRQHLNGSRPLGVLLLVGIGILVLGAGLVVARKTVPEWRAGTLPDRQVFLKQFQEIVSNAGFKLIREEPRIDIVSWTRDLPAVYRLLKSRGADWLVQQRRAIVVEVSQTVAGGRIRIDFSLDGVPWYVEIEKDSLRFETEKDGTFPVGTGSSDDLRLLQKMLFQQQDDLREIKEGFNLKTHFSVSTIANASPPQFLYVESSGPFAVAFRSVGTDRDAIAAAERLVLFDLILQILLFVFAVVLFVYVAVTSRVSCYTGLSIALIGVMLRFFAVAGRSYGFLKGLAVVIATGIDTVLVFFLWVAVESRLRSSSPSLTDSLDRLWRGQIMQRIGREVLAGVGLGASLAGIRLLLSAGAVSVPGIWPPSVSLALQNPNTSENAFMNSVFLVALLGLPESLSQQYRLRPFLAILIGSALLIPYSPWAPWSPAILGSLPVACVLILALRHFGLVAALTASLVSTMVPMAVFAAQYRPWIDKTLILTAVTSLVLVAFGLLAWFKPAHFERPGIPLAYGIWSGLKEDALLLLSLILPADLTIRRIWHRAERYLDVSHTSFGSCLAAAESSNEKDFQSARRYYDAIARAMYERIRKDFAWSYEWEPFVPDSKHQPVRLAPHVWAQKKGTCLELVLVYLAALEAVHFPGVYVQIKHQPTGRRHALAGYWRVSSRHALHESVVMDADDVTHCFKQERIGMVDCAGLADGRHVHPNKTEVTNAKLSFSDAQEFARAYLSHEDWEVEFALNVGKGRNLKTTVL